MKFQQISTFDRRTAVFGADYYRQMNQTDDNLEWMHHLYNKLSSWESLFTPTESSDILSFGIDKRP